MLFSISDSSFEKTMVAQGNKIHNDTAGPEVWTDESLPDREAFEKSLRSVDRELLVHALPHFHVITQDYVHVPLRHAFNWNQVASRLSKDSEGDWFIVAFRSVRKSDADHKQLYEADTKAHREAIHSGGLLQYWYGDLNEHRECLAMCIWVNRDYAIKATRKPWHLKAARLAGSMYETYSLERYHLVKKAGDVVFEITELS